MDLQKKKYISKNKYFCPACHAKLTYGSVYCSNCNTRIICNEHKLVNNDRLVKNKSIKSISYYIGVLIKKEIHTFYEMKKKLNKYLKKFLIFVFSSAFWWIVIFLTLNYIFISNLGKNLLKGWLL